MSKMLDAGDVELPGVAKGLIFNLDFLIKLPSKYGDSVIEKLNFMSALVRDLKDIGVEVEFSEMIMKK